jgi:hypothetical protein
MLTRPMDAAAFRWIAVRTDQYGVGGQRPPAPTFWVTSAQLEAHAGFPYTSRVFHAVNGWKRKTVFS